MHDFAITPHYTLFFDGSVRFRTAEVLRTHGRCRPFEFDEVSFRLARCGATCLGSQGGPHHSGAQRDDSLTPIILLIGHRILRYAVYSLLVLSVSYSQRPSVHALVTNGHRVATFSDAPSVAEQTGTHWSDAPIWRQQ